MYRHCKDCSRLLQIPICLSAPLPSLWSEDTCAFAIVIDGADSSIDSESMLIPIITIKHSVIPS